MTPEFMLDTDAVSSALRGQGDVAAHLLDHRPSEICLSSITLAELRFGADSKPPTRSIFSASPGSRSRTGSDEVGTSAACVHTSAHAVGENANPGSSRPTVIPETAVALPLHVCHDTRMIFGVSPTKDAVVIAQSTGSGETFRITSITSIPFEARSGDDLTGLLRSLVARFEAAGKRRRSTIALLGSSSGRFKSSIEAIKAEAITEVAAAQSALPVVRVTAASLKRILGCAPGQKWQARAGERFNPGGRHIDWSKGAAGAAAAAFKVANQGLAAGQAKGDRLELDLHAELDHPVGRQGEERGGRPRVA